MIRVLVIVVVVFVGVVSQACSSVSADCQAARTKAAESWIAVARDVDKCLAVIPEGGDLSEKVMRLSLSGCAAKARYFAGRYRRGENVPLSETVTSGCLDIRGDKCLFAGAGIGPDDSYKTATSASETVSNICK